MNIIAGPVLMNVFAGCNNMTKKGKRWRYKMKEHIIFTKENTKKLQSIYNKAVKNNAESFLFEGKEILTGYAKYLIEALKMKGI